MKSNSKKPSFNDLLTEMEGVVEQLEGNDTNLEMSLKAFEKGVALTRAAQKLLSQAEQKILLLTESEDGPVESVFDAEDDQ